MFAEVVVNRPIIRRTKRTYVERREDADIPWPETETASAEAVPAPENPLGMTFHYHVPAQLVEERSGDKTAIGVVAGQRTAFERRFAEAVEGNLENGFPSPEQLAFAILAAIFYDEKEELKALQITRKEFARYCADARVEVATWLAALDDAAMLGASLSDDWRGNCLLDLTMYVLRHSQHHLGDLFSELRRREIDRPKWR